MSQQMIPPAKPYFPEPDIEEMKEYVGEILRSGRLTLGEHTKDFERQFAEVVGVRHAIAVSSGTSALEIVMRSLSAEDGEVIIPTNTFAATCAAVVFAGGKPVVTDISPRSMTISAESVERAITPKSKGVIAVHIGGLVCPDIDAIRDICSSRGLFLVEDAAHAHGSRIDGRAAGSLGSAGCFSFYPTKVITSGEGGMITTDNEELSSDAKILRDQGKESFNSNLIIKIGCNWRMPEISAVLGMLQLRRLPEFIETRNAIAKIYDKGFDAMGIERLVTPPNHVNNYYKYTLFLPKNVNRDKFKNSCREKGVAYSGEVYWPPIHLQPAFSGFIERDARYEAAEEWGSRMVNPPMFSQMTDDQAERVIHVTREVLSELRR